jgi:hypothetical protein
VEDIQKEFMGFTVSGMTRKFQKEIYVTRKEELLKLLIHELIHYLDVDEELFGNPITLPWNINSECHTNEAYTETLSIIFHTMYMSAYFAKGLSIDEQFTFFIQLIHLELSYSYYLSSKILHLLGYNSNNCQDFFKAGTKHTQYIYTWEYIILRTFILENFEKLELTQNNFFIHLPFNDELKKISLDAKTIDKISRGLQMIEKGANTKINNAVSYILLDLKI